MDSLFTLMPLVLLGVYLGISCLRYLVPREAQSSPKHLHEHSSAGAPARKYPHYDPFLGLDLAVQIWRDFCNGGLSEGMRARHATYGATFVARNLGADCIYTVEPENIHAVTTDRFGDFGKSGWVAEAAKHVGQGILMNQGEEWKQSRSLLRPIFSSSSRTAMDQPEALEPHVQRLVARMRQLSLRGGGQVFDFHEPADMFTLDVVTEFLFGKSTDCLGDVLGEGAAAARAGQQDGARFLSLVKAFEGPSAEFIAVGPLAWLGLLPSYRRLIGLVGGMKAFFKTSLDSIMCAECSSSQAGGGGAADGQGDSSQQAATRSVFRAMKTAGISEDRIQGELQNIFFASYDTTSAFLANVMYVLARYPAVQQKLRDEISVQLGGQMPTSKQVRKLAYLRLVMMEALRLYSPVSSHSRMARSDTTLPRGGGSDQRSPIVVRAGSTVVWSTYSLNRDPRWYGHDWAEFRPERWTSIMGSRDTTTTNPPVAPVDALDAGVDGRSAAARESGEDWREFFMPFGSGPRACMGQLMVQSEVSYVVVRLLQAFSRIEMAPDTGDFREAKAVSFYKANGVWIRVK